MLFISSIFSSNTKKSNRYEYNRERKASHTRPARNVRKAKKSDIIEEKISQPNEKIKLKRKATNEDFINKELFKKNCTYVGIIFSIFASFALMAYLFYYFTIAFMNHPYFHIKHIEVEGATTLSKEDIIQISGIELEEHSFKVQLDIMKARLLQNPWIEKADVLRTLPDRFNIYIKERIPKFTVLYKNKLYYVDIKGELIVPVDPANFLSLPMLELGASPDDALRILPDFIERLENKPELFPFKFDEISWIRVSAGKGIEMYWEKKKMLFSIDIINWKNNIDYLSLAIQDLERKKDFNKLIQMHAGNNQVWLIQK